VFISFLFNY